MISVIIPTYNRADRVQEAISSVLAQTFRDFELLVVDDGSSDHTSVLLEGYGDRIRVIRQANQGVSAARNRGIQASTGQWIAFLDSDDSWFPGKLQAQISYAQQHPEFMIGQTEEIWIRNGVRVNPKQRHRKMAGMIFEHCLPLCLISPSAVMLRKTVLDEVGLFDETLPACEDYDLWLRITCRYPVHLIADPLIIKHGGHADQLSRMPELDKYRIQAILKILRQGSLSAHQRDAARAMLSQKCRIYAEGCRKRGRLDEVDYYLSISGIE
jgi:glycosyltransferase involved in cell wall biosynthesis